MIRTILHSVAVTSVLVLTAGTLYGQTVLYRDDMSGSNFRILSTNDLTGANTDPDVEVRFGFNYETGTVGEAFGGFPASIPEAPNTQVGDALRTGLYLGANVQEPANLSEVAALPLNPSNPSELLQVSGNYSIQADMWLNFEKGSGTGTQFGGLYVGHDATAARRGAGFVASTDGDASNDYRLYKNDNLESIASGQYHPDMLPTWQADADYDAVDSRANNHLNDYFQNVFLDNDIGFALNPDDGQGNTQIGTYSGGAGVPGFRWITITMDVRPNEMGTGANPNPGLATVTLQGTWETETDVIVSAPLVIGTIDNSVAATPVDMTGPIAVVFADVFTASINTSGFVFAIFDNLIITQEDVGLAGDYNGDGKVDAADYVVWRKDPASFGGDPDGYNTWRANFGAMSGSGADAGAVPEPGSLALILSGLVVIGARSRRRGRRDNDLAGG